MLVLSLQSSLKTQSGDHVDATFLPLRLLDRKDSLAVTQDSGGRNGSGLVEQLKTLHTYADFVICVGV